jgi:hypothetical protein
MVEGPDWVFRSAIASSPITVEQSTPKAQARDAAAHFE